MREGGGQPPSAGGHPVCVLFTQSGRGGGRAGGAGEGGGEEGEGGQPAWAASGAGGHCLVRVCNLMQQNDLNPIYNFPGHVTSELSAISFEWAGTCIRPECVGLWLVVVYPMERLFLLCFMLICYLCVYLFPRVA